MKDKLKLICINGVLFGTMLNRWATNKYGENGTLIVMVCAFIIMILIFILSAYKTKKYLGTFMLFLILSPLLISILGAYKDNFYMMFGGTISVFILAEIMNKKIFPWMIKNGKFKD
ncbi:hypothetical protein D4Z93_11950 [Clostridium fermenticellae]|uniref:Uncharacterized protein n=1 Tax=Clostridium fermenticellae TaxID=2068654 RepID=A0A386H6I8_9CLOT|nr:hypothetical protein [Clostridium fermenticellae]AYD41188.1 hypothetical protein D4Z93_11950 [Clostridium fermenticellae]